MAKPEINLIYAISSNGIIGKGSEIPWYLPPDLVRFKQLTQGDIVIMGRKTWESLPAKVRPLKGRVNIIVTTNPVYYAPGATVMPNCSAALEHAKVIAENTDIDKIWIIGGESVYDAIAPVADAHYVTFLRQNFEGDVRGPTLDGMQLRYTDDQPVYERGENEDPLVYTYQIYQRRDKKCSTTSEG